MLNEYRVNIIPPTWLLGDLLWVSHFTHITSIWNDNLSMASLLNSDQYIRNLQYNPENCGEQLTKQILKQILIHHSKRFP